MKCTELKEDFVKEIKKRGLVDERNIMFVATCTIQKSDTRDWIFALKGEIVNMVLVHKGKLDKFWLKKPNTFEKANIKESNLQSLKTKDDFYVIQCFDGKDYAIEITGGTIPIFDKFLAELGLK